jgi:hypothetical protein
MHEIEMQEVSNEFARCWHAAGRHMQAQVQGRINWLKANLNPPFLEHLSFRLGNQLFFVRLEPASGSMRVPGGRGGLLSIAQGCNGHACIMPMVQRGATWAPNNPGWGLVDPRSGMPVDPIALVSDELVEMTDWELQDFAVQVVREQLEKEDRRLMSWQGNPAVDPSIWFIGTDGPEWVVVRVVRYPMVRADVPANWASIVKSCARLGKAGHFASVALACAEEAFERTMNVPPKPLWRGHGMCVRHEGMERLA